MIKVYEKRFNEKIDCFKNHPKYAQLRKSADEAIRWHTCFGLDAIHAQDFMDRIIKMPLAYIEDWLNNKNALDWIDKLTHKNYDEVSLADALNQHIQ